MALAATGREAAAERLIDAMRRFGAGPGALAAQVRDYALPVAAAVLAHARGRHAEALDLMRPALGGMHQLGGSHAQQDVFEQLFLDAALAAGSVEDARLLLQRVAGRHVVPLARRRGYAAAARQLGFA
jgi:hypothetical protein